MASIIPVTALQVQAEQGVALRNQELREAEEFARQRAAYNALRAQYGDIAGDPQSALQLQDYGFNEQMNPLKIENQRLTNTGLSDRNNFLRESYPLQIEGLRLGNEGAGLDNETSRRKLSLQDSESQRAALLDAGRYVKRRMTEGADPGAAFDEVAPFLPVTPEQAAQLRDALVADPSQIDAFLETFGSADGAVETGVTPHFGVDAEGNTVPLLVTKNGQIIRPPLPPGVTLQKEPIKVDMGAQGTGLLDPVTRQLIGIVPKTDLSADQRVVTDDQGNVVGAEPIPGSKLDREVQEKAEEEENRRLSEEAMAGAVAVPVLRTINRSLNEYIPNFTQGDSYLSATERYAKSFLPGTAERNFLLEFATPFANISLERLQQMRAASATGASGLGQVTEAEHQMLQNSLGAIDVTLPPEKLAENVRQLHNIFLDTIYGTKKQRDRLVAAGKLDAAVSAEIDKQYMDTEFDQFGNRREDAGEFGDADDDDLLSIVGGGRGAK